MRLFIFFTAFSDDDDDDDDDIFVISDHSRHSCWTQFSHFLFSSHTLSRIFFPLAVHAHTAACNIAVNNAGLKIFKRSAWWMFYEEQHTHSLQHASLQNVDTARLAWAARFFLNGAASALRLCLHGMHSGAVLSVFW